MKQILYKYGKIIYWSVIILVIMFYLLLYFYPSMNNLKTKKEKFEKTSQNLSFYKKEIKNFKEPTEEEKILWQKIEKEIKGRKIILSDEKELLSLVSDYIEKLRKILVNNYDDFLIEIQDKKIKINQSLKDNSELKTEFKVLKGFLSVKKTIVNTNSFVAYQSTEGQQKQQEAQFIKINLFFLSSLKKTSVFLYDLVKQNIGLDLDRIIISTNNNNIYYLITLKINIEKAYENVKK